jgi:hypothetical protein
VWDGYGIMAGLESSDDSAVLIVKKRLAHRRNPAGHSLRLSKKRAAGMTVGFTFGRYVCGQVNP